MLNIAVLVSGGGTNLQALIDAEKRGEIHGGRLALVVSSRPGVKALERADKAQIPSVVLARRAYGSTEDYGEALTELLLSRKIDLIVLAGFLTILPPGFVRAFPNKIINIHPSLIPAFCGEGYYGLRVHEEALRRGVKYTGATVHFVNEGADEGPIILQKPVSVLEHDTPETLQRRVMEEAEWKLLPLAASLFCEGRLSVENGHVTISGTNETASPSL